MKKTTKISIYKGKEMRKQMNNKHKTKSNKLIQGIVAMSTSACMILTSFGVFVKLTASLRN